MCIACELGYWSMIDALAAERRASNTEGDADDLSFVCEPTVRQTDPEPKARVRSPADEPTS